MSMNKAFVLFGSLAVAVVVIAGLYIGGSPREQRLLRFDESRVQDLQGISWAIERRWERAASLSQRLDQLIDGQILGSVPLDPMTDTSYVYETSSSNGYRLCADFAKASVNTPANDFWSHEAGFQCFEFTLVNKVD